MRFLFVCSSLGGGGAERVAANLANTLVSLNHSVSIFVRREVPRPYNLNQDVRVYNQRRHGNLYGALELKKLIDDGFDVVVGFTDIQNILSKTALIFSTLHPAFIPTIHNDLIARDSAQPLNFRFLAIRTLHKLACRSADKVVVVSEGARVSLSKYYELGLDALQTIYNPVLSDNELIELRPRKEDKGEIKLVAAGRLTQQKNYRMMIDVVQALKKSGSRKYLLDVYGAGELTETLQAYAVEKGVEDRVAFKGFSDNLKSELSGYDMFLLTSDWEGFGNVLVEALCAGIPVISTDCPSGPREILAAGKFGRLVPVGDVDAFCNAVEGETREPLDFSYEELCAHLDNFREGVVAQKYIELVQNVKSSKV